MMFNSFKCKKSNLAPDPDGYHGIKCIIQNGFRMKLI